MEATYVEGDGFEITPEKSKERLFEEMRKVTTYIKHYPGRNMTEISRAMKWSIGKTQQILNHAEEIIGSIYSIHSVIRGRNHRKFFMVPWYNRIDWSTMLDDEELPMILNTIVERQTEAYRNGYAIVIKDSILQDLLEEYMSQRYRK
jgi:hypothetical protein